MCLKMMLTARTNSKPLSNVLFCLFFFSMGFSDIPYIYIYERMALFGTEKIERNKVLHGTMFFFVTFFSGIDISICIYPSVYVEILWLLLMLLLWLRG